jgi:hypothetical protein
MKRERKIIDRSYIILNLCEGGTTRDNPIYRAPAFDHRIRAEIIAFRKKIFLIDQKRKLTNDNLQKVVLNYRQLLHDNTGK